MAEIAVLGLKLDSVAKPNFFGKKYASEQVETPMNIDITIVEIFYICHFVSRLSP